MNDGIANWGQPEERPASQVTLADLDKLCERIRDQRIVCEEKEALLKEENKRLGEMETKLLFLLKELGREKIQTPLGTFYIYHRTSVKTPKTPEDREAFFQYLKADGMYDQLISVNSQTLNSYVKAKMEAAIEADPKAALEFKIPGLGEPSVFETLGFKKGK